ncbi:hypothetical protein JOY44_27140 (plasmid) [Phormidium sp. CLA17]|uniref:hypothetical protein n=1 Tax=Leptolyngbya sp. Cla-17 TaxID=2803751 RepID=UPI001490DD26|nr:hypothetical protein [Leptolyngbya sp. Cla-17]MBM0745156.1 hypothetical protein [Leptolyngbya sp. Cla-17]
MATSPSYLQALPKDEAIALVTSLQKVKEHLCQELQWMDEQRQQKTVQIQGIETLLFEVTNLGLVTLTSDAITEIASPTISDSDAPLSTSPSDISSTVEPQINGPEQDDDLKTKSAPKPSTASIASATTAKQTKPSPKSIGKQSQSPSSSNLRQFLKAEFQETTFTEAVAQILEDADKPLHLDDLLEQMYGKVSDKTFQRAKVSLANVLSTGTGKGRWKSAGKGFYVGNTTVNG